MPSKGERKEEDEEDGFRVHVSDDDEHHVRRNQIRRNLRGSQRSRGESPRRRTGRGRGSAVHRTASPRV